ncbi:MAG: alpha/beta hydrolase [Granulosicoccus sp.]
MSCRSTLLLVAAMLLSACETPTGRLHAQALAQGFERSGVVAEGFRHTVFTSETSLPAGVLHVYLEGDGTPWRYRVIVMADPTPRRPLMLKLMALDPSPSVYVGRPCYNGTATDEGCHNALWTSGRYSTTVVESMASVIRKLGKRHAARDIWLFGHSGGGALAMLLAERIPQVTHLVTVAGNLNTSAWTAHHGYTPLYSSMNPAQTIPLRTAVRQWHLVGELDTVIPPRLVSSFIQSQSNATGIVFSRFGHGCCWQSVWPQVLTAVATDQPKYLGGRFGGLEFKQAGQPVNGPGSQ